MLTTSHAYWTLRATPVRGRGWRVLGSVLPDLPGVVRGPRVVGTRQRVDTTAERFYQHARLALVRRAFHAAPFAVALPLLAPADLRGPLRTGWLSHVAIDFLTHHGDAWRHGWPLSDFRFRSPVSYHEVEHHALTFSAVEVAALSFAVAAETDPRRRVAGLAALAIAARPLTKDVYSSG